MRGLVRLLVVGFTVITLMLVAALGVSAASGSARSGHVFDSVTGLFSGHSDVTGAHTQSNGNGNGKDECPPEKKHHFHRTGGHKHHPCGDGDPGEDDSG